MKRILFSLAIIMTCLLSATNAMADELIKTPVLEGTINDVKAKMQLVFNADNNQVTGWYYYDANGEKGKRELKGTYDGDLLSCSVEVKDVKLDEASLSFTGDYMTGTIITDFSGTATTIPEGFTFDFSFSN